MAEIVQLPQPPLRDCLAKAAIDLCYATCTQCDGPELCIYPGSETERVVIVAESIATSFAGDEALAREIGRDAVSAICRRLRAPA